MNTERVEELISELVEDIPRLGTQEARQCRAEIRDLEMILILSWLWQWPLSSAKDLEGLGLFGLSKIHNLLKAAADTGLVMGVRQGRTFEVQNRYFLDLKGIYQVRNYYRIGLEWQVTEEGVKRLIQRLRMVEAIYRVLPGVWRSGAVAFPRSFFLDTDPDADPLTLDDTMRLTRFHWVRQGEAHAIAQFQTVDGSDVCIPVHWYGIHHKTDTIPDLAAFYDMLDTAPDFRYPGLASPPGVVIVAVDPLAALQAQRGYAPGLPAAIVSPEGRLFQKMMPVPPRGFVRGTGDAAGRLGTPAKVVEWLDKPEIAAINGVTKRAAAEWVENWPSCLTTDVAEGIGQPRSKTTAILDALMVPLEDHSQPASYPRRLVQKMERSRLYLGTAGILPASRRDRTSYQTALSPLAGYLNPRGRWRRSQADHSRRVARLAIRFQKEKAPLFVAPGWRLVINYENKTQLAPDLWLQVPSGDGGLVWHCVEYEQTAVKGDDINGKLNPYRIAMNELREPWPLLVICKTRDAADEFGVQGDDLPMLLAVYDEVIDEKERGLNGERSVWRYRGGRVDISHLVGLMVGLDGRPNPSEWADSRSKGVTHLFGKYPGYR